MQWLLSIFLLRLTLVTVYNSIYSINSFNDFNFFFKYNVGSSLITGAPDSILKDHEHAVLYV